MSCSGVAVGDVSEESSQEKLQLPQWWWQALEGGGRMEQREMFVPHLFLSCFPETERSWVPSEQHPHTHCCFRQGSLFCLFHATWWRQSNRSWGGCEVDGVLLLLRIGPGGSRKQKAQQRGSCHSTMPATPEGGQDQSVASSSPGWIIECVQTCQLGQPWAKWP